MTHGFYCIPEIKSSESKILKSPNNVSIMSGIRKRICARKLSFKAIGLDEGLHPNIRAQDGMSHAYLDGIRRMEFNSKRIMLFLVIFNGKFAA